ncbi:hypothetical protein ACFP3R_37390, partial [Saccharothrix lopnurensis]
PAAPPRPATSHGTPHPAASRATPRQGSTPGTPPHPGSTPAAPHPGSTPGTPPARVPTTAANPDNGTPPPTPRFPVGPPAPPPGNRRAVLGAVAAVVVVLALATYLVLDHASDVLAGDPGPTPTPTATTSTTTKVKLTLPTTTAAPTPTPAERTLLAALPGVYRDHPSCATAPADAEGVTAAVVCTAANETNPRFAPPARAHFRLFTTRAAQDAHFLSLVTGRGIPRDDSQGGCRPKTHPVHYAEYWRDPSGALDGDFTTCYLDGGTGHLWWTDSRTTVTGDLATAPGATDDTLDKLDLWWNGMILSRM